MPSLVLGTLERICSLLEVSVVQENYDLNKIPIKTEIKTIIRKIR